MHTDGNEVHIDGEEASGGSKEGVVRYVLIIGLVLAIGALSIIWMTGALTQGDVEEEATASGRIASEENGEASDSIVGGELDDLDSAQSQSEMQDGLQVIENDQESAE